MCPEYSMCLCLCLCLWWHCQLPAAASWTSLANGDPDRIENLLLSLCFETSPRSSCVTDTLPNVKWLQGGLSANTPGRFM